MRRPERTWRLGLGPRSAARRRTWRGTMRAVSWPWSVPTPPCRRWPRSCPSPARRTWLATLWRASAARRRRRPCGTRSAQPPGRRGSAWSSPWGDSPTPRPPGRLRRLLGEEDPTLREAAVVALGRIGTAEAAAALATFAPKAPEALRHAVVAAELQAAERLCRQGSPDAAIKLYESLQSAESERVRAAAYRGLISAKPSESAAMILAGLAAAENWKRAVAADCLAGLATPDAIATVAAGVPKLPPEGKIAAFDCLKSRSHPAIRAAALASLEDADAAVRAAAVEALVNSGAAEDVPLLARLASTGDEGLKNAACDALQLMTAEGHEPGDARADVRRAVAHAGSRSVRAGAAPAGVRARIPARGRVGRCGDPARGVQGPGNHGDGERRGAAGSAAVQDAAGRRARGGRSRRVDELPEDRRSGREGGAAAWR